MKKRSLESKVTVFMGFQAFRATICCQSRVTSSIEDFINQAKKLLGRIEQFSTQMPYLRLYRDGFLSALLNVFQNSVDSFQDSGTIEITDVEETCPERSEWDGWIKLIPSWRQFYKSYWILF